MMDAGSGVGVAQSRAAIRSLGASKIREVANAGMGRADVLPFWFGESDRPTPAPIADAARQALADGAVFYTHNLGNAPLREALARYVSDLHGATEVSNIGVTSAGVNALMLCAQLLLDPGDEVVAVTPLWPNLLEIPRILGASVRTVALDNAQGRWRLDLDRLLDAITPRTRMVFINSPNNPTGWVMTREEQRAVLDHCRRLGVWIVADDVYERLYYGRAEGDAPLPSGQASEAGSARAASSFLDLASRDERVVSVNSFSKAWLMTGWRIGWITAPQALSEDLGKLIEFNTSCAPDFVQRAAQAALAEGEAIVRSVRDDLRAKRDHLAGALAALPGVEAAAPDGAMYVFFSMPGADDSVALCKRLVAEAGLGLAPGAAFGPAGEGHVRWCYARALPALDEGVARLARFLG
ncbi:pyridoxal phosphate-dependent aminotransferase [Chitinasiproducens palmae]|uniref:Aminotransferase n=1 Tax=Chitinasiproducens palmae TaxID=1770053 RepID=A0A1H2PP37_9BURK|nr:pyridoxal phosphate-dependent aminotransferase [Chitinasiproducens palmae]SDV47631.1 Aspartate/methionine/tyrosine aminotransferase [Chitinasiproducens palmae]